MQIILAIVLAIMAYLLFTSKHKFDNATLERAANVGGIISTIAAITVLAFYTSTLGASNKDQPASTQSTNPTNDILNTVPTSASQSATSISTDSIMVFPGGYVSFEELINGKIEATGSEYFQHEANTQSLCFKNRPDNSSSGYFLAVQPKRELANFDGVSITITIDSVEGNWASIGFITFWGKDQIGVKLGLYYVGPGPSANGTDGEISVVTSAYGDNSTESSEVFQIHPDLTRPFTLRVEKSGSMLSLYYNDSDTAFATRSLPSVEMYGTYTQLEGNVSANTDMSACWSNIGVLYR